MCSHIPNRGEQMVRYYGYYSNVSRGKRQKEGRAEAIPCILESQGDEKTFRRNWARLIRKVNRLLNKDCRQSTYPVVAPDFSMEISLDLRKLRSYTPNRQKQCLINSIRKSIKKV